jgi:cation:H+ antiporter
MKLLYLVTGLLLLIAGAELLVRGASRLAAAAGVSPLVIGLTVVAFGTSAPEMFVSVVSAANGQAGISLGNVLGSNLFNVLFILGLSALIAPLAVSSQLVRFDVPFMIAVSLLTLALGWDGRFGRLDGLLLFTGVVFYTLILFRKSGTEPEPAAATSQEPRKPFWFTNPILVLVGLGLLVLGSKWLVEGAVGIARYLGVSDLIVGLTVVAAGTSLPEAATSIVAAFRGQRDIAVGNVVGSNIFNVLAVLGLSSIVTAEGIPVPEAALGFDIPVMIAVSVACLPIFFTGNVIERWEGALFLAYYVAYALYLVLSSTGHDLLPLFNWTMVAFVIPITLTTLVILSARSVRSPRGT